MSSGGENGEGDTITLSGVNRVLNEHLQTCALTNQAVAAELRGLNAGHEEIKEIIRSFRSNSWKAIGGVGMLVLAAAVTLLFQNLQFKQDIPTTTDLQTRMANRYTSQDAAADRARQEQVNQAILSELKMLRKGHR